MRIGTREKNVGLPPRGDRHPDPIADLVGSHPKEAAMGAALAGIFLALAFAAVAGPAAALFGAIVGAVAGACIGHGVGEVIAPRLRATADIDPGSHHHSPSKRAGSNDDKDDFETFGTDRWPAWYDSVALTRREQRQPELGAGVS